MIHRFIQIDIAFPISEQISAEAVLVFEDVTDEFSQMSAVLEHFQSWRDHDMTTYKDTYFNLCLPKVCPNQFEQTQILMKLFL